MAKYPLKKHIMKNCLDDVKIIKHLITTFNMHLQKDKKSNTLRSLTCLIATSPIFGENFRMFSKKSFKSDIEASFMFSLNLKNK
jgi:hypothetical protein